MRGHTWRVCVVGPSTRFLSGITYYTYSLCRALNAHGEVSAILMRQLLPTRLYPGHARVGAAVCVLELPETVRRVDGVDWFWVPTLGRALWFLAHWRPDVLILQWWTGTVLHTYLALAGAARTLGIKVVVEFHETSSLLRPVDEAVSRRDRALSGRIMTLRV